MSDLKTKPTGESVEAFLRSVPDPRRRADAFTILKMMREVTGAEPQMWGDSIVGFGEYHYKYASGREGNWFLVGFSPRKRNLTIYLNYGFDESAELMQRLGKHRTGAACLYVNKLQDVDLDVLREVVTRSADSAPAA
jgi:hypothetical protein